MNKALVHSVGRGLVPNIETSLRRELPISAKVVEPDNKRPLPAIHALYCSDRISRRPVAPETPKPRIHHMSTKEAAFVADKVAMRDRKQRLKNCTQSKLYCSICRATCNRVTVFYNYTHSQAHRIQAENENRTPFCKACNRTFRSHQHLKRHLNGTAHLKTFKKNLIKV